MKVRELDSWAEFRGELEKIRAVYGEWQITEDYSEKNRILFRGQSDADWSLQTTLERTVPANEFSLNQYMILASASAPQIESVTAKQWGVPDWPDIEQQINAEQKMFHVPLPYYDYLVHLRHNGFPSPLLDWTESPYIAAYFAFCDRPASERVAVFAYIERPYGVKHGVGGAPMITVKGPYARTHGRHFAQKASYTMATRWDAESDRHMFCGHEIVFGADEPDQDVLIKLTIPATDRIRALTELVDYNIDHFTLFQNEEALVRTLGTRLFELEAT